MTEDQNTAAPIPHEIIIQGILSKTWEDWFEGLTFHHTGDGRTILTGEIIDQATLHGLLKKLRDLGLTLLSVNRMRPGSAQEAGDWYGSGGIQQE